MKRYDLVGEYDHYMEERKDGDYVLFDDVEQTVKDLQAKLDAQEEELDGLRWSYSPAMAEAKIKELAAKVERLRETGEELIEVARLRGDNDLPQPPDDPKLWTARMQTAWDEFEEALNESEEA